MTVIDRTADFALPAAEKGKIKFNTRVQEISSPPVRLYACSSSQVVSLVLLDPQGFEFARLGTASFPK